MKTTVRYIMLMTMVIVMAMGCSKSGNEDADSLIRTVPADASAVAVVNLEHLIDILGSSTDGSTIKLSEDAQKFIDKSSASEEDKKVAKDICDGNTGIALNSIVYFSAARSYITGLLNDPNKFAEYVSNIYATDSETKIPVIEENGAKTIGDVIVIGNQFWICITGTPDTEQLKYYANLNERQSFYSTKASSILLESDKAVAFVADINRATSSIPEAGSFKMGLSLMFEDLAYLSGDADYQNNTLRVTARLLNSDMNPSKLLLPTEKIDTELIKSFGGTADSYFAVALGKKLIKKISDLVGIAMGNSSNQIVKTLEQIDGTVAVRGDSHMKSFEAKVQTTGNDFAELSTIIQNLFGMDVTRTGNVITAKSNKEEITGNISADDAADKLKGAWIGGISSDFPTKGITSVARLSSEKGSLRFELETEGDINAVMTTMMK